MASTGRLGIDGQVVAIQAPSPAARDGARAAGLSRPAILMVIAIDRPRAGRYITLDRTTPGGSRP